MEWKPKWVSLPILDFSREVFSFKDNPQKGWEWVMDFMQALLIGAPNSKCELANEILKEAIETRKKKSDSGKKGMKKRWNSFEKKIAPPKDFEEVIEFIELQGIDYDDARLWWQRNFVERPGCDKDGVVFDNWKGALINACKAESEKRRKAG